MNNMMHVFPSDTIRIVCISDTHNDDPTPHIPDGDLLIHAGDLTNDGTAKELLRAYQWIAALPHPVKVIIAGNNDRGLDRDHDAFSSEVLALLTSADARAKGIRYLDRETATVARYCVVDSKTGIQRERPLNVYANASTPFRVLPQLAPQPEAAKGMAIPAPRPPPAFVYDYAPSKAATRAWETAPRDNVSCTDETYVPMYVTHGGPLHHLDDSGDARFTGCSLQEEVVTRTRPILCVFGHFHGSWGAEITAWGDVGVSDAEVSSGKASGTTKLVLAAGMVDLEESPLQGKRDNKVAFIDAVCGSDAVACGASTLFVNAAWRADKKVHSRFRNPAIVVSLKLP